MTCDSFRQCVNESGLWDRRLLEWEVRCELHKEPWLVGYTVIMSRFKSSSHGVTMYPKFMGTSRISVRRIVHLGHMVILAEWVVSEFRCASSWLLAGLALGSVVWTILALSSFQWAWLVPSSIWWIWFDFVCCCFTPWQHYFNYIMVVIWCMRWEGKSLRLHLYRLKGSLISHTIYALYERNWPLMTL